jgi:hypothetical protein
MSAWQFWNHLSRLSQRLRQRQRRSPRQAFRYRPGTELLEDRCLPSTSTANFPNLLGLQQAVLSGANLANPTTGSATPSLVSNSSAGVPLDLLSLVFGASAAFGTGGNTAAATAAAAPAPAAPLTSSSGLGLGCLLTWSLSQQASAAPAISSTPTASPAPAPAAAGTSLLDIIWGPGTLLGATPAIPPPAASPPDPSVAPPDTPPWVYGQGNLTLQWFTNQPSSLVQAMFYNTTANYNTFVNYFYGYVQSWTAQADAQGITGEAQLEAFFTQQLNAEFQATQGVLAAAYPGLTETQYRLLMSMNLVDGFYTYNTPSTTATDLYSLLHMPGNIGSCSEIAQLTAAFAQLQGISAQVIGLNIDFTVNGSEFYSAHQVVSADGMWLDAQTNIAFNFDPVAIQSLSPYQRLPSLLNSGNVYGFYNWYLNPSVRAQQLAAGQDGGSGAFDWYYYLAGLGQGTTTYYNAAPWLPPLAGS